MPGQGTHTDSFLLVFPLPDGGKVFELWEFTSPSFNRTSSSKLRAPLFWEMFCFVKGILSPFFIFCLNTSQGSPGKTFTQFSWGRVGKCIYREQVNGNFKVGKFYPLFDSIFKLVKEKGESWDPNSPPVATFFPPKS